MGSPMRATNEMRSAEYASPGRTIRLGGQGHMDADHVMTGVGGFRGSDGGIYPTG